MPSLEIFRPRTETIAKKILFALSGVAAGVTLILTIAVPSPQTTHGAGLTILGCSLILALSAWMLLTRQPPGWVWAAYPFLAVLIIAVLDITSADASVTAQVFFFFPVLYAGAELRRAAAVAVTVAAVAANSVVALTLVTGSRAFVDISFVTAALTTTTVLLVLAGERADRLIAQLERQAAVDPLTGLLTRRVLDRAATAALGCAGNDGGTALLLVDVDHFKNVNDAYGHPAGDAVLQQLAALLLGVNRSSDVTSRLGGDEMAVLLPGCTLVAAMRRANQIVNAVRAHEFDISSGAMGLEPETAMHMRLSVCVGVAHLPTHAEDLRALYAAADVSLYDAKQGGRDRVGSLQTGRPQLLSDVS